MTARRTLLGVAAAAAVLAGFLAAAPKARAVPSFTRQTGQECAVCHVGAFGPQLTPYGIKFKIGGYTEQSGMDLKLPLSGMLVGTLTHTGADQKGGAAPGFGPNDNAAIQEISAFLAGRITDHVGAFAQVTYSGVDKIVTLDNFDVRLAFDAAPMGQNTTFGLSFNNNPTVQDPFNTLPAWRYPFITSDLAPSPAAAPLLDGGLEGRVIGATGYMYMENGFYAEAGGYASMTRSFLQTVNVIDPADPGPRLVGGAPYGRLAWFKDFHNQAISVGVVAMAADLGVFGRTGRTDHYKDIGADVSWQWLGDRTHVFTVSGSVLHEVQDLQGSVQSGDASHASHTLDQVNVAGSYTYDKTWTVSSKVFATTGSGDRLLYPGTGKPDSNGLVLELGWTPFGKESSWGAPWANVKVGLQYTAYGRFDGATRHASDNNTLMGYVWTAF